MAQSEGGQAILKRILETYGSTRLPRSYGIERIKYITELSLRFTYATLLPEVTKNDPIAVEAFSMWLSLIWAVDGVFDTCRALTRARDVQTLEALFMCDRRSGGLGRVLATLSENTLVVKAPLGPLSKSEGKRPTHQRSLNNILSITGQAKQEQAKLSHSATPLDTLSHPHNSIPSPPPKLVHSVTSPNLKLSQTYNGSASKETESSGKSSVLASPGQSPRMSHPLISSLVETVEIVYARYLELMESYIIRRPFAFDLLQKRLRSYLNTLRDETLPANLDEYETWRSNSGAMDCVLAHAVLFHPTNITKNDIDSHWTDLNRMGTTVSFYNDLLSVKRDLAQRTPNLVLAILQNGDIDDAMEAMKQAIDHVSSMTDKIRSAEYGPLRPLALAILEGSVLWHNAEPRYADGLSLLESLVAEDDERFFGILLPPMPEGSTPGDPKLMTPRERFLMTPRQY